MENTRGTEDPAAVPVSSKSPTTGPKGGPTSGTKLSPHTCPRRISDTKLSQHTPSHRMAVQSSPSTSRTAPLPVQSSPSTSRTAPLPVQNSPSTSRTAPLPVQNSPCSPEMAQYGAFSTCRESFIPFSPPRSQAGRVMYRSHHQEAEQGKLCTEREAEIKRANTTTLLAPQV